ncbi:uncharacterized protein [Pagrus major]|uniref:uncharacterized protein n=1 Tax=Pagrus major TaxID=143350 RepID=UPI003CC862EB
MIHVRLSRTLNLPCGAFTVLVLLALTHSCRGQHHVIGPTQPIVATVGEDVVLPGLLDPVMDAFVMTVEWTRPDLNPSFVYVWRDGVELESKKHPLYEGRTSVFTDELKLGNVSLKLSKVRTSDEGRYRCFIPDLNKDSIVQLVVGAASSPEVQMTKKSSGVVLQCESTGWYPEPEVFWLDAEGNLLSAGPTETVRGPDDLYTVSSRVTVEKRHSNSFTCRVQQNHINQIRETLIHVPDDFFTDPSGSGSSLPVIIGVILSFVFVLAAAVVVWKWRQNKIRNKKHHEDEERRKHPEQELLMGPETDRKQPTEDTDTVHNVDEFRAETGLQTETDEETLQREANNAQCADSEGTETQSAVRGGQTRETETGLDKSQEETETKDAPLPTDSDQKNREDETESVSDNTEKLREERQKDNNLQTEEDKEKENLKKQLKTKEEEVTRYEEQINEVKQQLEEVKRQTEEAERKMSSVKKEEEDYKLLLDLNRKKEELQEQLKKLEKLLEGIKKSENNVRQKKLKATTEDKKKERELETFEKQLSRFEGQMKDKEKQINEVRQQLEEVERQTEEAERRMRSVNREEEDLKRKKAELQEQLEKSETQLEGIKKSEIVATQKKLKATNEKEEIIMKLKELETQRNQRSHSDAVDSLIDGLTSVKLDEDGGTVE